MNIFNIPMPDFTHIPTRYVPALETIFQISMNHDRAFIARSWLDTTIGEYGNIPKPTAWILRARALQEAQDCSVVIRNIVNSVEKENEKNSLSYDEMNAIYAVVNRRVKLLTINETKSILDEMGIPVYFHSQIGDKSEILIVPFMNSIGFSTQTIYDHISKVPESI